MTERKEPSDLQKGLIAEGTYLRGRILAAYAQIEFLLADLSVKLDLKFPYLVTKRIKAAKDIANRPGYEAYRDELVRYVTISFSTTKCATSWPTAS